MSLIRLIFTGLVTFVPNADYTEVCVVMVDARNPLQVPGTEEFLAPHVGGIRVDHRFVEGISPRPPDLVVDGDRGESAIFLLDDEQLTLAPTDSEELLLKVVRNQRTPDTLKPCCTGLPGDLCVGPPCGQIVKSYQEQRRDFDWLISLAELHPADDKVAKVKGDCFDETAPPSVVLARFPLPAGTLITRVLEGEDDPGNWYSDLIAVPEFNADDVLGHEEVLRALTRDVALEIIVSGVPELEIASSNLFTGQPGVPIKIQANDRSLLEVRFFNSSLDVIRHDHYHAGEDELAHQAHHFLHFYRLSESLIDPSLWRVPARGEGAGDLLCPPEQGRP